MNASHPSAQPAAPFRFCTGFILPAGTGLRAATLPQLARFLREVPESCIYHHTHYFLFAHQYLTPEPTNDFAYWVTEVLGERPLGALLARIDTMQHASLQSLREAVVATIEQYLQEHALARFKFASDGEEFFFVKSMRIIMPTSLVASTLAEFADTLQQVSLQSLYFHVFDARLRLGRPTNDFALWLEDRLGRTPLVEQVATLDPYGQTLESLRATLIRLVRAQQKAAPACPA